MPNSWGAQASREQRTARTVRKGFRGDADGRVSTATPVVIPNRVQRPGGGSFRVFVQPDDPLEEFPTLEIGTLWFDTDEPVL